ncbi:histidine phosphatase family protein [Sinisalibacter lacisalsi]|uniref:Histidine phosphatase family protein n=1 Tax=Sinisalibacter lacisalsi TaxID=1526570 RepID=A0ABQ1QIL3_9RHOB|nr:histidine phosphatase family protein [Sinisalibacter lacisalsi]GGD27520.1 hypothetical protein GCM10011358_09730 [Sinisalibacter lacisalsi]
MLRRSFFLIAFSAALAGCGSAPVISSKNEETRLVVLRHADRTTSMLNEAGRARAAQLPAALSDLEIDAIYTTPRQRNIDTATPLAEARGLEIGNHLAWGASGRILDDHPGETVVWVGNQENLGLFYAALGLLHKPPVQFGDVHVITLGPGGSVKMLEKRRYGD